MPFHRDCVIDDVIVTPLTLQCDDVIVMTSLHVSHVDRSECIFFNYWSYQYVAFGNRTNPSLFRLSVKMHFKPVECFVDGL